MSTEDLLKTILEFVAICTLIYGFYKEEKVIEIEDRIASTVASHVKALMNTSKIIQSKAKKESTSQKKRYIQMKFGKRKKRVKRLPPKSQYVPTFEELKYCEDIGISPSEYVDIKYENAEKARRNKYENE